METCINTYTQNGFVTKEFVKIDKDSQTQDYTIIYIRFQGQTPPFSTHNRDSFERLLPTPFPQVGDILSEGEDSESEQEGAQTWSITTTVSVITCLFTLLPLGYFGLLCPCDTEEVSRRRSSSCVLLKFICMIQRSAVPCSWQNRFMSTTAKCTSCLGN